MRRGDVVTVAATADHGKPRLAVIVQTDAFPESHAAVVLCQLRSELEDAPDFRVTIVPKPENGLRVTSQVMADKPVTIRRKRIGQKIGRLGSQDMARLNAALAFVLALRISSRCRWSAIASGSVSGRRRPNAAFARRSETMSYKIAEWRTRHDSNV